MKGSILLYGMGGHALVLLDLCRQLNYEVVGYFADKAVDTKGSYNASLAYLGDYDSAIYPELPVVIAIGNNEIREAISNQLTHTQITLIHPSAVVASSAHVGLGSVVLAAAVIQPFAQIGQQVIVNAGAIIDHEAVIEDFAHIRPAAYVGGASQIAKGVTVPPLAVIERLTRFNG